MNLSLILDLETTGLNPDDSEPIQVAFAIGDTAPVAFFLDVQLPLEKWTALKFHQETGFLQKYLTLREKKAPMVPLQLLDAALCAAIPPGCVLVGNQPQFDLSFLKKHAPNFAKSLSYRMVNVSSIRDVYCDANGKNRNKVREGFGFTHDALDDVNACRREIAYYARLLKEPTP